ncbi:MAG TPA: alginate export family protein [Chitinophagales bacterium]|nr:alginate export family protein [Chitinophagales bacterium]
MLFNATLRPALFLPVAVFLTASPLPAPAQFTLSGEFRPRAELRFGYSTLPDSSSKVAFAVSQRTRLNALYKHEKFWTYLSLQDVRVWGDEEQIKDVASTALHEAWAEIIFSESVSLKFGRQELVYEDHRLLGNVDWTQQARSHDAALLKLKFKKFHAHLGGAYNQQELRLFGTGYTLNNYKTLMFLWLQNEFRDNFEASLYTIADGFTSTDSTSEKTKYRVTAGPALTYKKRDFTAKGSFFWQDGKSKSNQDISAYFFSVMASYQLKKLLLAVGYDYLSGSDATDPESSKEVRTFNTLYATNHKFYGHMDYFINIPADTKNGGLIDAYLKGEFKATEKISAGLDAHYFGLTNNVPDPENSGETLSKYLGVELDLYGTYAFNNMVNFKIGYSTLFASSSMEAIKGGDKSIFNSWAWLMITVKPVFLEK